MKNIPYINLKMQHALLKDEILDAIGRVLEKSNFILGDEVSEFEEKMAQYCGVRYAVGVNSGTDALFLSLKAFGIGQGDEVITAPNSFLASASVVAATGARPVFVDIREDLNINPALIEKKITTNTKAIIPVHLTGKPADMDPIISLAQKYNIKIIEDAAQAIGAEYHNMRVGSFGDTGCFSLHPLKTLNACGDAGVITTNDDNLYQLLIQMRNIGLKNRDESDIWGYNSRLDTMQAAILNVKIKYLDEWTESRRRNADYYISKLKKVCDTPPENKYEKSVYHTFVVGVDRRKELIDHLEQNGIGSRIHYPIPIHLQKAAQHLGYKKGDFPVCEKKAERILSLPVYQGLTGDDLEYIVEKITGFYNA
jgi:dTDP-4-amino-4,6-dideoxygalactose transaminase